MSSETPETPMLLVLDLETTGLDPDQDQILEVGAILLNDGAVGEARFHAVAYYFDDPQDAANPDFAVTPLVREMHTKNGLWDLCAGIGARRLEEIDLQLQDWLEHHGAKRANVVLVGHSIHFDLSFVRRQLPHTSLLISHRVRDIGAIAKCLREWGVALPELPEMPHRALADCEIELAGYQAAKKEIQSLVAYRALR